VLFWTLLWSLNWALIRTIAAEIRRNYSTITVVWTMRQPACLTNFYCKIKLNAILMQTLMDNRSGKYSKLFCSLVLMCIIFATVVTARLCDWQGILMFHSASELTSLIMLLCHIQSYFEHFMPKYFPITKFNHCL
jgi:hypothetical protein